MKSVFDKEDEILASAASSKEPVSEKYGELTVNTDLMELHMKSALSTPRNARLLPVKREAVGGFIFRSLAKSGLMVLSEKFQFRRVSINVDPNEVIIPSLVW